MGFRPNSEGDWSRLCRLGIIIPQLLLTERKMDSDLLLDAEDSERIFGLPVHGRWVRVDTTELSFVGSRESSSLEESL